MWKTRGKSIKALRITLKFEANLIYEGFEIIEKISQGFSNISDSVSFCRICNLVLIKGRNLCQAIFSLTLEGLAQESSMLLRLLIEVTELLEYFYQKPSRTEEAINETLPSAGVIAKKIRGDFKGLRGFLNNHSAHVSISAPSMSHLINWNTGTIKIRQNFSEKVLKTNLTMLCCFLVFLNNSAYKCLSSSSPVSNDLTIQLDTWIKKGQKLRDPFLS